MLALVAIFAASALGLLALVIYTLRQRATAMPGQPVTPRKATVRKGKSKSRPEADLREADAAPAAPTGRRRAISAAALDAAAADAGPGLFDADHAGAAPADLASDPVPDPDPVERLAPGQAIVFRQVFPPVAAPAARSAFGGLPLVQNSFEWPRSARTGLPLHFLLQVDCASVPAPARPGLLPDEGVLYVFADLALDDADASAVIWRPATGGAWQDLPPPTDLPPAYAGRAAEVWPWALGEADGTTILPRWPFDPLAIPLPPDPPAGQQTWNAGTATAALLAAQGETPLDSPVTADDFAATGSQAMARPWPDFPRDWLSVQIVAAHLVRAASAAAATPDQPPYPGLSATERDAELARVRDEAQAWFDHALRNAAFDRLEPPVRAAFWDWFASHAALARLVAPAAFVDAVETALYACPHVADEIPPAVLARLAARHALVRPDGAPAAPPRMLASPTGRDDLSADAAPGVLLLELPGDPAIGHHFGPRILQWRIAPADLAARDFARARLDIVNT